MKSMTGTVGCSWGHCSPAYARRHMRCRAMYQTEAGMPQQPPPPPPPPPAPGLLTRRSLLQRFGSLGAGAVVGGVGGFVLGSRSDGGNSSNLSAAERSEVDELRREMHFRRDYDGRVFVQDGRGGWWEVRVDTKLPGTLLLRDPEDVVFFISYDKVQQIDLTDDYVVAALFEGGDWEASAQRVQVMDDSGELSDVRMPKSAFRDMISVRD